MYRPARKTNPRHALSHGGPIVLLRMRHAHTENGGTHVETQGVTATGIAYRSLRKKGFHWKSYEIWHVHEAGSACKTV